MTIKISDALRQEILSYFQGEMRGSVPDSIHMLERYSPGAMEGFYRLRRASTIESSLPKKVQELIIIAVEAALKKDPAGHARIAVEAGATPQEIHDAVALVLWLAGMPAYHHGMKAVQAAEEHQTRVGSTPGTYPLNPVTFVSAAPRGGGWHQLCERTAAALKEAGLVPVDLPIETTPGGLKVFEETVASHRGNAYRLIAFSPGLTLQLLLKGSKYSYHDVTPLAALSTDYGALVVPARSSIGDLQTLLRRLRGANGLSITGGSGPGAMHHGMVGVVAAAAGVPAKAVSYVGNGGVREAIDALLGGQVPVAALGAADVVDGVRDGALRVLAVLSEDRLPAPLADVPTARELGLEVVFPMWRGFYGPPAMPEEAVAFWTDTFTRLAQTSTWKRALQESNWYPLLLAGHEFRRFLDADMRRYAQALGVQDRR